MRQFGCVKQRLCCIMSRVKHLESYGAASATMRIPRNVALTHT